MGCLRISSCLIVYFLINYCSSSSIYYPPPPPSPTICSIEIPENNLIKPIFYKSFGTKAIKVSSSRSTVIYLNEGEELLGYCATKFKPIYYNHIEDVDENDYYDPRHPPPVQRLSVDNKKYINITCAVGIATFLDDSSSQYQTLAENSLSCNKFEWKVYESKSPHNWCSSNSNSYILTINLETPIPLAAICFNIQTTQLESIRYTDIGERLIMNQEKMEIPYPREINPSMLGVDIDNFASIVEIDETWKNTDSKINQERLLPVAIYEHDFITQGAYSERIFHNYGDFLKINWWQNLLHGNWKRFSQALSKQTTKYTYDIFVGISGGVWEPYYNYNDCNQEPTPKLIQHNDTLPAYIWTYLSGRDINEEFVVIGYNSAFFEFFDSKEIIFCKNMCNEIPWLKKVSATFSYSTLGVVFCCTAQDVRQADVLKGFPKDDEDEDLEY